jgi:hypothetical protein
MSNPSQRYNDYITINEQVYSITAFCTLDDIMEIIGYLSCDKNNYRYYISELIYNKLTCEESNRPSIETIASQSDDLFELYIALQIREDNRFKLSYEKFAHEKNVCYRFMLAIYDEWQTLSTEIYNEILPLVPHIRTGVQSILCQANTWHNVLKTVIESANRIQNAICDATQKFVKSLQWIQQVSDDFKQVISTIQFPSIDDERRKNLICSFRQWGEYGWSIIPIVTLSFYNKVPVDQNSANKKALIHFTSQGTKALFNSLYEIKSIKKTDLDEAIFCFEHRQYKACALIIITMLDAKLIRSQTDKSNITKKRRTSGKAAAQNLLARIAKERGTEDMFFFCFSHENLRQCLNTFFEDGKDFKQQPNICNRNFLSHGMLTRPVKRLDCIQLFLLLKSLFEFLRVANRLPKKIGI